MPHSSTGTYPQAGTSSQGPGRVLGQGCRLSAQIGSHLGRKCGGKVYLMMFPLYLAAWRVSAGWVKR